MADLKNILTKVLKEKLDSHEDFLLVNVLSKESFEFMHIPGSLNADVHQDDFLEKMEELTGGDKGKEIVVYCSSATCQASPSAARKLAEAGYSNVAHFSEGLAGWKEAGYEFERAE
ncbi:MAG: rhodanese-like domain-containing protein [Candidatus Spechtbacterales bacterium]